MIHLSERELSGFDEYFLGVWVGGFCLWCYAGIRGGSNMLLLVYFTPLLFPNFV